MAGGTVSLGGQGTLTHKRGMWLRVSRAAGWDGGGQRDQAWRHQQATLPCVLGSQGLPIKLL